MKDVESQAVHVKILPSEAVEFKRALLETQLSLVGILRAMINLKELRKAEFKLKSEMKTKMREISSEIDKIVEALPAVEEVHGMSLKRELKGLRIPAAKRTGYESKERSRIDAELMDIKKQIQRLGY